MGKISLLLMSSFALSNIPSFKDTMPCASKRKTEITQLNASFKAPLFSSNLSPSHTLSSYVCLQTHKVEELSTFSSLKTGNKGLQVIVFTLKTRDLHFLCWTPDIIKLEDPEKFWQNSLKQVLKEKFSSLPQSWELCITFVKGCAGCPVQTTQILQIPLPHLLQRWLPSLSWSFL